MAVSVDTMDCAYLNVDICGEMKATTTHEIIAMTAEEYSDLKNIKTEVESIQQLNANLLPIRSCAARRAARSWILSLMHVVVPTYVRSGCKTTRVMKTDAD